ncbi:MULTISPECIES: DUF2285 domain-containing protein [unclassified Novosphingobium]|uniref:DUF2285 domain-containing protein n=1 Tax=unclassified Novosphingobium TaxID=2644732 RepID=UPI00146E4770|nr:MULTISPECIES: DUF2285 domain-containing protein [unclassified Novosphingobium]NMN03830.1 hypothetical protein [Novosphingobium sp. SG919]NMN86180.1 hypothetical protein [Novosphingobium sp. SG916]
MTKMPFEDAPPLGDTITPYDLAHLDTYLRLLDASRDATACWKEAMAVLFGLDVAQDPERAWRMHATHLARAQWMSQHGYRQLAALQRKPLDPK